MNWNNVGLISVKENIHKTVGVAVELFLLCVCVEQNEWKNVVQDLSIGLNYKWSSQINLRNRTASPEADLRADCFSTFLFVCLRIRKKKRSC